MQPQTYSRNLTSEEIRRLRMLFRKVMADILRIGATLDTSEIAITSSLEKEESIDIFKRRPFTARRKHKRFL